MASLHDDEHRSVGATVQEWALAVLAKTWGVLTVALLMTAIVVRFDLVPDDSLGPLVATSEVAAGRDGGLITPAAEFAGAPSVRYAGVDISIIEARSIPQNRTGAPIVVVELGLHNTTDVQARIPVSMLNLVAPTGRVIELDRFEYTEFAYRLALEPADVQRGLAVFKLGTYASPLLADYQLQIGEAGRWPIVVPLEGDLVPPAFPRPLQVAGRPDGPVSSPPGATPARSGLAIELVSSETVLEYGAYRAPIGQHLAVITVLVDAGDSASATGAGLDRAAVVDRDHWTLSDGRHQRRAIRAFGSPVDRGSPAGPLLIELVFAYEMDSPELTLQLGPLDDRVPVVGFRPETAE